VVLHHAFDDAHATTEGLELRRHLSLMRYPFYLLADSREGRVRESVTKRSPAGTAAQHDIRQRFVYERVSHITLKSISDNPLIDEIWEKCQKVFEPLRQGLDPTLVRSQPWEEWKIPRDACVPMISSANHRALRTHSTAASARRCHGSGTWPTCEACSGSP